LGEVHIVDIKDIRLKYYCHVDNEPLKSITQLCEKDALDLAIKHRDENPCNAHGRFGSISTFDENFVDYYNHRKKVEKLLYERFISLGGKPQIMSPYYFFVQDLSWVMNIIRDEINNGIAKIIEVNLKDIDIFDISFVLGDSTIVANSDDWDNLFLKDTLMKSIAQYDGFENYFNSIKPQYPFIEAQLWTDKYHHLFSSQ
jgi:hypothetical protein